MKVNEFNGMFSPAGVEVNIMPVMGEAVSTKVDEKELRKGLKSIAPWLRRELGSVLTLRYTPELLFERDLSMERGQRLNEVFRELEQQSGEAGDEA